MEATEATEATEAMEATDAMEAMEAMPWRPRRLTAAKEATGQGGHRGQTHGSGPYGCMAS